VGCLGERHGCERRNPCVARHQEACLCRRHLEIPGNLRQQTDWQAFGGLGNKGGQHQEDKSWHSLFPGTKENSNQLHEFVRLL